MSSLIPILRIVGDVGQFALPIGVGLHALYKGHRKEGIALGAAAGIQQIVLNTLKKNIGAPRPFPHHLRLDSFPSGHTAGAFLAVGFVFAMDILHLRKSGTPYFSTAYKVGVVFLALIVGISRYLCRMHWPLDIAVGSMIGLFFGSAAGLMPSIATRNLHKRPHTGIIVH